MRRCWRRSASSATRSITSATYGAPDRRNQPAASSMVLIAARRAPRMNVCTALRQAPASCAVQGRSARSAAGRLRVLVRDYTKYAHVLDSEIDYYRLLNTGEAVRNACLATTSQGNEAQSSMACGKRGPEYRRREARLGDGRVE